MAALSSESSFSSLTRSQLVKALGHAQKSLSREALVDVLSFIQNFQANLPSSSVCSSSSVSSSLSLSSASTSSHCAVSEINFSHDFDLLSASCSFVNEVVRRKKIALRIAYAGWDFQGFAYQPGQSSTVEGHLFHALRQARLITDQDSCDYSMAGRTDAGVSALGQVIALLVRDTGAKKEMDYIKMLNSLLPENIRITGWANVSNDFSARLSARNRKYKYFFPRGRFDIECMKEAAKSFVGQHDFRSFSKLDRSLTKLDSTRVVYDFTIESISSHKEKEFEVYAAVITGQSFLWHQIRCMMAVLFEIGLHRESPSLIRELLDVSLHPRKPQYAPVPASPLVLVSCLYPDLVFQTNFQAVSRMFSMSYLQHLSQASFLQEALCTLENEQNAKSITSQSGDYMRFNFWGFCGRSYIPLLSRPTEGTDKTDLKRFVSRAQAEQKEYWLAKSANGTPELQTLSLHRTIFICAVLAWAMSSWLPKRTRTTFV